MEYVVVDVREPEEFASGHVMGAINMPPSNLMNGATALQNVPKDTPLLLYCRSGARSAASMQYLRQFGFTNLTNGINKDHIAAKYGLQLT